MGVRGNTEAVGRAHPTRAPTLRTPRDAARLFMTRRSRHLGPSTSAKAETGRSALLKRSPALAAQHAIIRIGKLTWRVRGFGGGWGTPGARPGGVCRFLRHLQQAWSCAPGLCRVGSQAAGVALVSGTGKIGSRSRGLLQVWPGSVSQRGPLARADGELETRSSDHRRLEKRPLRVLRC